MAKLKEMTKRLEKISGLLENFEKGDPFLKEIDSKLAELEEKLLKGLEEDDRIKALKNGNSQDALSLAGALSNQDSVEIQEIVDAEFNTIEGDW